MEPNQNEFTIRKLIKNLSGHDNFFELLFWPPDVFALTSIILQRTGAYRICLIEAEDSNWSYIHRNPALQNEAAFWFFEVGKYLSKKKYKKFKPYSTNRFTENIFRNSFEDIISNFLDFDLQNLRLIASDPINNFDDGYVLTAKESRKLAVSLVNLHCLADIACSSVGMVKEDYTDNLEINSAIIYANLLLTSTGSLSTFSKLDGIVLPKFRTPQQGQSLRALSLHLTFHISETEIVWRTIPWLETTEKTINIMAIPFPYSINAKDFDPIPEKGHPTRYFKIRIEEYKQERLNTFYSIIEKLIEMRARISRIHILVFPELALTKNEYDYFLFLLYQSRIKIHYLPIVVAGVLNPISNDLKSDNIYNNEVRISNFFAGRWYDINQRKHHRWKLDKKQLIQYQLYTKLSTNRDWFEYTSSSQRRLTIFSPNSWLSLTALICEDLARLEPVSEIIRGVGPTLLLALLSDGPQLSFRWSARYATVFADDPGTSVLSLTSFGMTKRSKKNGEKNDEEIKDFVVGLWKDSENQHKEISLNQENDSNQKKAIILSLTAKEKIEHTIDGRNDNGFAPEFELNSYFQIKLNDSQEVPTKKHSLNLIKSERHKTTIGDWNEIREISLLYYSLDNIINTRGESIEMLKNILLCSEVSRNSKTINNLNYRISKSLINPLISGLGVKNLKKWPSQNVDEVIKCISEIINSIDNLLIIGNLDYFDSLFNSTYTFFQSHRSEKEKSKKSVILSVCLTNCIIINAKICDEKITENLYSDFKSDDFIDKVYNLRKNVTNFLEDNYVEFGIY